LSKYAAAAAAANAASGVGVGTGGEAADVAADVPPPSSLLMSL